MNQRCSPDKVWRYGQNEAASSDEFDVTALSCDAPVDIERTTEKDPDNHHSPMKPGQYINARLVPMLHYYQKRVPIKYREWKLTVFLMLTATSSIAVLSYLSGRPGTSASLRAAGGVVSGLAGAITAWHKDSNADRKINRYANAVVALENHMLWWDTLPPVD
eukprot:COSAG04_NODE_11671_length_695_cov_0.909396_1_plen_161_part_10